MLLKQLLRLLKQVLTWNAVSDYKNLMAAVDRGLLTEDDINTAVKRVFTARFKLGMFDPDEMVPYAQIPFFVNCSDYNNSLSRLAAQKSIVLLKNDE